MTQDFESLSTEQQELLAPLEEYWEEIPVQRKARLAGMADRLKDRSIEEQQRFQQGLDRFISMESNQRRQVRALFDRFGKLPPGERQRVIDRVSTMSEAERGAFVLGMRIADRTHRFGGGIERYLGSLPEDERRQLVEELKPLSGPEKLRRIADELEAQEFSGP